MYSLVWEKFSTHEHLRNLLLETGDQELIEGNTWGDTYWGTCNGVGENHFGKFLMNIRDLFQYEDYVKGLPERFVSTNSS